MGNIQLRFFFFFLNFPLRKPLESVYLSAGTHPYQQPCSNAPPAEECQKRKGEKGDEAGKEALWKALICTQETYMATPPANAALLEHICVCVGWGGGGGGRGEGWLMSVGE